MRKFFASCSGGGSNLSQIAFLGRRLFFWLSFGLMASRPFAFSKISKNVATQKNTTNKKRIHTDDTHTRISLHLSLSLCAIYQKKNSFSISSALLPGTCARRSAFDDDDDDDDVSASSLCIFSLSPPIPFSPNTGERDGESFYSSAAFIDLKEREREK